MNWCTFIKNINWDRNGEFGLKSVKQEIKGKISPVLTSSIKKEMEQWNELLSRKNPSLWSFQASLVELLVKLVFAGQLNQTTKNYRDLEIQSLDCQLCDDLVLGFHQLSITKCFYFCNLCLSHQLKRSKGGKKVLFFTFVSSILVEGLQFCL